MTTKTILRAALVIGILPLTAFAQEASGVSGEITTGVGYQSSKSALFGRYTGNTDKGMSGIGSFQMDGTDAREGGKTDYFRAEAKGISVDRRQVSPDASGSVRIGEQGKWDAKFDYDGLSSTSPGRH